MRHPFDPRRAPRAARLARSSTSAAARPTQALFAIVCLMAFLASEPAHASFYWANPQPTGNEIGGVEFEDAQTGYAVGAYGTALRTTDGGATWNLRSDPDALTPSLRDLLVLGPGVLLAAGQSPGLFRSEDGGATWTPVTNPASGPLNNLFALDSATIFAVGDNGKALRSTDGGATYTALASPGPGSIVDQCWLDAQHGYVIGPARVRRTTDGGQTWSPIPGVAESGIFFPGDINFLDALNGWILTDFDTYRTTDGGGSWFELPMPFGQSPIYPEEGIALTNQIRLVGTEAEGAEIWKTTNDGANWTRVLAYDGARGVTDLARLPDGTLCASTTAGDLLRSIDDGDHWTNATRVAGPAARADLNAVDLLPGGIGFAGGYGSSWMATSDGGRNWHDPPATPGLHDVYAIQVRDPLFILAGGIGTNGHSDVRRSTDGGASWTAHNLSAGYVGYPQGLAALPGGTCFCATYGGTGINFVYRSTDQGSSWHLRNAGVPANLRLFDIQFLDDQTGFVCGGDGGGGPILYRTTDGGGLWTPVGQAGLLIGMIQDMCWITPSRGFVVGDSRIQRTTNGGISWTTAVGNGPWGAIDFRDAGYGVATELDEAVWITTDGGDSWARKAIPVGTVLGDVVATPDGFLVAGETNSLFGWGEATTTVDLPATATGRPRLVVWPNPVRIGSLGSMQFRLEDSVDGIAEASLFDVCGRRLAHTLLPSGADAGRIDLNRLQIPGGVLLLSCRTGRGLQTTTKVSLLR